MSDTPRTDAALQNTDDGKGCATSALYVFASFARTLERELAAERAAREQCEATWRVLSEDVRVEQKRAEQAEARLAECKRILTTGGPSFETRSWDVLGLLNSAAPPPILAELERLRALADHYQRSNQTMSNKYLDTASELAALKPKLEVAKNALANLPLAVSSIGPCSGTKDWNDGYDTAARHAAASVGLAISRGKS